MIRYFNLKEDPEKFGGIIRVDTSIKGLVEKLSNPQGDFIFTPWTFKHVRSEQEGDVYEINMPNELAANIPGRDALGGKIGVAIAGPNDPPSILKIILNKKGEIRFYNPEQKGFYLSEISEKAVEKHREAGENWALQRAYILE